MTMNRKRPARALRRLGTGLTAAIVASVAAGASASACDRAADDAVASAPAAASAVPISGAAASDGAASSPAASSEAAANGAAPARPPFPPPTTCVYTEGSQEDLRHSVGDWVYFDDGRDDLDDQGKFAVDDQAHWLLRHPDVRVTVIGYAEEGFAPWSRHRLASRRAKRICDYLAGFGVPSNRIKMVLFGKGDGANLFDQVYGNHGVHLVVAAIENQTK
jgi:outer membrane protein OmpA-like peptidoglycan-associated protein